MSNYTMLRDIYVNSIAFPGKTTLNKGKWIIKDKDLKRIRIFSLLLDEITKNKIPPIITYMKYLTPISVYEANYWSEIELDICFLIAELLVRFKIFIGNYF